MTSLAEKFRTELEAPLGSVHRPSWRGRTHMVALFTAIPVFVVLLLLARGASAKTGVVIYGVGLCAMFGVSTTYHRWVHSFRARAAWQRADHATIYAAIAGTATPVALVAMPRVWGIPLLVVMWTGAICGAVMKAVDWKHATIVGGILYIVLGWIGLAALPAMWRHAGAWPALCLIGGGVLYTVGAVGFAMGRPKLKPAVFGYHEVWHLFTIAAATAQLVAVWAVVTR